MSGAIALRLGLLVGLAGAGLVSGATAAAGRPSASSAPITLAGRVLGGSGRHAIYVALWDEKDFLGHPVRQLVFRPEEPPVFHFVIPPGRWALSAFEDENGNGILDMGHFGPKEPSGFWHPFHAWRKPRFSDVAVLVEGDTADADIHLGR